MKTDALKTKILEYLQKNSYLSFQELEQLCHANQKKVSNGEKRQRDLRAPMLDGEINVDYRPEIGVTKNPRGAITGYTWGSLPSQIFPDLCCYSFKVFQSHDPSCTERERTQLIGTLF